VSLLDGFPPFPVSIVFQETADDLVHTMILCTLMILCTTLRRQVVADWRSRTNGCWDYIRDSVLHLHRGVRHTAGNIMYIILCVTPRIFFEYLRKGL